MIIPLYIVDAFTDSPFKGNQAGVCLLEKVDEKINDTILQKIAFEMNLSETAFIYPINKEKNFSKAKEFNLRWFTPTTEVDLCGHATLASAHVLFHELLNSNQELHFHTLSGILPVSKEAELYKMDFPANPSKPIKAIEFLASTLGLQKEDIITWEYDPGLANILIEVANDQILRKINPDYIQLQKYSGQLRVLGLIVTTRMSDGTFDFASRYFGPWVGLNEDPVTGSSHTTLGPFWSNKLRKNKLRAIQLSKRTGDLTLTVTNSRVFIKGRAYSVVKGTFTI